MFSEIQLEKELEDEKSRNTGKDLQINQGSSRVLQHTCKDCLCKIEGLQELGFKPDLPSTSN